MNVEVVLFYRTMLYLHKDVNAFLCLPCLIIAVLNANVKKHNHSLNNRVIWPVPLPAFGYIAPKATEYVFAEGFSNVSESFNLVWWRRICEINISDLEGAH